MILQKLQKTYSEFINLMKENKLVETRKEYLFLS